MKPIIIVQARVGSSRLPKKMIKPFFENKTVLEILLERIHSLLEENYVSDIIVATSQNAKDDTIIDICKRMNCHVYRGSEKDVLRRFIEAAETYHAEKIIRICADNVFLDIESLKKLAVELYENDCHYISFMNRNGKPSILTHFGFFAEGVKLQALKNVAAMTTDPIFHEHVTNKIYTTEESFDVKLIPMENVIPDLESHPDLRLTLDTIDDFNVQQKIYADLSARGSDFSPSEIMKYLDEECPEYYEIMRDTIKGNTK